MANRLTCGCNPGYSQSGFAGTLRCTLCPAGQYATNYSKTCLSCPPGFFSKVAGSGIFTPCPEGYYAPTTGSTDCLPCPIGFFNPQPGQPFCEACSGGQITPGVASINEVFCLSPLPNFTMGFIALALVMLIGFKYILHGNFSRTAFFRRERYVMPVAKLCMQTNNVLKEKIRQQPIKKSKLKSRTKAILFILFSIIFVCLYVAVYFIGLLYHIFFTSMILWRSLAVSFHLPPLLDILSNALASLSASLGIPLSVLSYILLPGIVLIKFLSNFQLNLSSLNVTCNGAKAPIELLIDFFILAVYIIFVKSEYFLLWSVCFKGLNLSFITSNMIKRKIGMNALACIIVMAIFAMNPLQSFLRYSLTFASVSTFVADHGMHPRSPSCDNVSGAPQFDTILGITSTIMAYLLFFPVVYLLSEVIVPGRIRTRKHQVFDLKMLSVASKGMKAFNYFKSMVVKVQPAAQEDEDSDDDDDDDGDDEVEEPEEGEDSDGDDSRGGSDSIVVSRNGESAVRSPSHTPGNLEESFSPQLQRRQYRHPVKKAKAKNQDVKRNVYIKYLEDKAKFFLSFDVWILSGFAAHWVKYLHKINREKKGEKSRRVTGVVSLADSIKQFQQKSHISATADDAQIDRIIASFNHYAEDSIENERRLNAQWEEVKLTHLPPYAQLCRDVRLELHVILDSYNNHLPNATIALVLATVGIGHFFTVEGWRCWEAVMRKYYIFIQVCFGIWTDESFEAFEIDRLAEIMLTTEEDEGITLLLAFIVGPRSLLFQAVQYGTIFSAFVLSSSLSPLFVFSKRLREKNFPDMLFTIERARALAITREIRQRHGLSTEYFHDYRWIIYLRALIIVATESRAISFLVQMIVLAIIFMLVLFPSPATIQVIVLLFVALVPYAVIKSFLFVVYFGKSIDMRDDDFKALFCIPVVVASSSRVAVERLSERRHKGGAVHDNHYAEPVKLAQPTVGDVCDGNNSSSNSSSSSIYSILEEKSSDEDESRGAPCSSTHPVVDTTNYDFTNNPQRQQQQQQQPLYIHASKKNAHISIVFDSYDECDDVDQSSCYDSEEGSAASERSGCGGGTNNKNEELVDMIKISTQVDGVMLLQGGEYLSDSDASSMFDSIH